jgi:hypothetical protein
MLKKSIMLVLVISILVSLVSVPTFAVADEPSTWAKAQVKEAIDLGIVPMEIQGKYQQAITREEFASLFVTTAFAWQKNNKPVKDEKYFGMRAVTKEEFLSNIKVTDYSFADTSNEDIKIAYMLGLVNGTSKIAFSPHNKITRQEAAVMLVNYYQNHIESNYRANERQISDLNKCAVWAIDSMSSAFSQGFLEGVSGNKNKPPYTVEMGPLGNFTREQAIIVAKRVYYMKVFAALKLRGTVDYVDHALKVDWEVSSNKVTAIKLKEGMTINERQDNYVGAWNWWEVSKKYPTATSEQMYAGGQSGQHLQFKYFSDKIVDAAGKGENAIFDLGYAEYEILNKDYIFQYRLKNNGVHNHFYYGGSGMFEIEHIRIK